MSATYAIVASADTNPARGTRRTRRNADPREPGALDHRPIMYRAPDGQSGRKPAWNRRNGGFRGPDSMQESQVTYTCMSASRAGGCH
ncbi:hypothetical protein SGPA1_40050 [Streptomyces misionensis JCM 4497]